MSEHSAFVARIQQGRENLVTTCQTLRMIHHPGGWRHEVETRLSGKVNWSARVITCPRPTTRKSLYIYLYLVSLIENEGHATRGRAALAKSRVRQIMRHHGIAVPRKSAANAVHSHSAIDATERRY